MNYKKPTIGSLMKLGKEDEALELSSKQKSQKQFVEALREKQNNGHSR